MARGPCLLLAPWGTLRGSPPTPTTSLYIGHNRIHREEVLEIEDIQIEVGGGSTWTGEDANGDMRRFMVVPGSSLRQFLEDQVNCVYQADCEENAREDGSSVVKDCSIRLKRNVFKVNSSQV
ncbi:hypothetical protein VPH35_115822 [Triticum aestivum]